MTRDCTDRISDARQSIEVHRHQALQHLDSLQFDPVYVTLATNRINRGARAQHDYADNAAALCAVLGAGRTGTGSTPTVISDPSKCVGTATERHVGQLQPVIR